MPTNSRGTVSRRWIAARVAHPVRDLTRSAAFYGDVLGLPARGGFAGHEGYDGTSFALPGGGELELTTGPAARASTDDDLLVLYLRTPSEVQQVAADLEAAGVPGVPAANPYWTRWGRTFLDPDGRAVVVAAADPPRPAEIRIEIYTGDRAQLRTLFELAEDSPTQLGSYLHAGRVLAATAGPVVVGHLQLVDAGRPGLVEIKNMAVRPELQGQSIGAQLVQGAVDLVAGKDAAATLEVATAAADVGLLRFYQRQGFRMRSVERDAFTPASGYPPGLSIHGVPLRDRVWLDRPVASGTGVDVGRLRLP